MTIEHIDPARSIIAKIGVSLAAEITGRHISRVYRWMYPKERGGTGGVIPHTDAFALLAYAKKNGVNLSPADFFQSLEASE